MTYSVILAGNGETSRANVEALMDDHHYANGEAGNLVIAFNQKPSQGQVWAAQLGNQRKLEIVVFSRPGAFLDSISHASLIETDTPIKDAIAKFKGESAKAFLLWSDEDPDCLDALAFCKKSSLPAYDLCEGLSEIVPTGDIKPSVEEPKMPEIEATTKTAEEIEFEQDEEDEDEEDEEEYDEQVDEIYAGIEALAELIANKVFLKLGEFKTEK